MLGSLSKQNVYFLFLLKRNVPPKKRPRRTEFDRESHMGDSHLGDDKASSTDENQDQESQRQADIEAIFGPSTPEGPPPSPITTVSTGSTVSVSDLDEFEDVDDEAMVPSSQMPPTQIQNQPQDQLNQVNNNVFLSQSDKNKDEVQINIKNIADNIVTDEYCIQFKNSIKTDPVSETLASTLNAWLRNSPNKQEIKELFQQCLIPNNVEALNPIRINELLYPRLTFKSKEIDKKLKAYNTFVTRALGPLITLLDIHINVEAQAKQWGIEVPSFTIADKTVSVKDMREHLVHSIKLLSAMNSITIQKRKVALRPYLDPKYQSLTRPSNPVTSSLLGDNIEQKMTEIYRVSQATNSKSRYLVHSNRNYRNRKGFRGAHTYYNTNYNNKQRFQNNNFSQARTFNNRNNYFKRKRFGQQNYSQSQNSNPKWQGNSTFNKNNSFKYRKTQNKPR